MAKSEIYSKFYKEPSKDDEVIEQIELLNIGSPVLRERTPQSVIATDRAYSLAYRTAAGLSTKVLPNHSNPELATNLYAAMEEEIARRKPLSPFEILVQQEESLEMGEDLE